MVLPSCAAIETSHCVVFREFDSLKRIPSVRKPISGIHVEAKFHYPPTFQEKDIIGKVLHEKNPSPTGFFNVFRGCGIRQMLVVKSMSLVFNAEFQGRTVNHQREIDILGGVILAAVFDGIVHRLCHGDHDIAIDIVIEMKFLPGVVYEALNHPDVLTQRRHFNANRVHSSLVLVAKALEILIHLILVIWVELRRHGFEQFYLFFL